MKYIFKNIRGLAKNEKFIFAIMLLCVFVSAWVMLFSYGLYQNFHALRVEGDESLKELYPKISDGQTLTYGEFKTFLEAVPDEVFDDLQTIYCTSQQTTVIKYDSIDPEQHLRAELQCVSRFTFHDGLVHYSGFIGEHWNKRGMITSGRYFTDDEEISGNNVVMLPDEVLKAGTDDNLYGALFADNATVKIFDKEYSVVGAHSSYGLVVPFLSMPPEEEIGNVAFSFDKIVTHKKFDALKDAASKTVPGKLLFEAEGLPDNDSVYIYNNIMMLSVLIAALTIINFAFLYNFIFKKRSRQLAIMRICGCTRAKALIVCLGECVFLCVPIFLIGTAAYIPFMHGVLADMFEFMEDSYSVEIYFAIFGIYLAALFIIMGVMLGGQISKTLTEGSKRVE